MIDLKALKEYLPVITAFLGAFLAYVFSGKKYRQERFFNDVNESLKTFYSPTFHELRNIKIETDPKSKETLMEKFIDKYTGINTQIYICHNEYLVQLFYDLDQLFRAFKAKRKDEDWEKVYSTFDLIDNIVSKEYRNIQRSLYKSYPWQKIISRRNYIIKPLMEFSVFLYDTASFILILWLVLIYILFVNRFTGHVETPQIIKENFIGFSKIVISIYSFGFMAATPYFIITLDHRPINKVLKNIDIFIFSRLGKIFNSLNRSKKNIPKKYIKKDLGC